MSESKPGVRVGPLELTAGVSRFNLFTYLYAAFICIGILAGMNFLQPYVLTENLNIPRGEQGTVSGDLGLNAEDVRPRPIEDLAPKMIVGRCINELRRHT